jgi:hypothetical protein
MLITVTTEWACGQDFSESWPRDNINLRPDRGNSELVIAQGFHLIDVSDDRVILVKLGFDLTGDLIS